MISLQIPAELLHRLASTLKRAGHREIGGVLVGENISKNCFKLLDFSVQKHGGSGSCFIRDHNYHRPFLEDFFDITKHNYQRFNYLGEWHSHPSFPVDPSHTDMKTMEELISDPEQGAAFALLMICRFDSAFKLTLGITAFREKSNPEKVFVKILK